MKHLIHSIIILITLFSSCSESENNTVSPNPNNEFIRGADLSFVPQLENLGLKFYDNGLQNEVVRKYGMNTVQIRL
ncbi:MAG: hypothetical protein N4A59_05780 [Marinifilum sp.]|nr:hypothetical protein [Marinifilum sp.]